MQNCTPKQVTVCDKRAKCELLDSKGSLERSWPVGLSYVAAAALRAAGLDPASDMNMVTRKFTCQFTKRREVLL